MSTTSLPSQPSPGLPTDEPASPTQANTTSDNFSTPSRELPPTSLTQQSPQPHQTTPPTRHSTSSPSAERSAQPLAPTLSPFRHGRLVSRSTRKISNTPAPLSSSMSTQDDSPDLTSHRASFPPGDARSMSPRRDSVETDRLAEGVRHAMEKEARDLQSGLLDMVDRIEAARVECERLEGGNRFLQSYIGELMQTSRVTQVGGRGRR